MLVRNITNDYGMVNGALAFMRDIQYNSSVVVRIFIRFTDPNMQMIFKDNLDQNAIPTEKSHRLFT